MRISMKLFAACAVALSAPSYAVTIVNGGFEALPNPASGGYIIEAAGASSLPGWYVIAGSDAGNAGLLIDASYSEPPLFQPDTGNVSYDITGAGNTGANAIYQDIATAIGQSYQLVFALGNAPAPDPRYILPSSINLYVDDALALRVGRIGGLVGTFTNAAETAGMINWAMQTVTFTATSTSTRIAFQNATPQIGSADNYAGLDSISIAAVPEAATWGMMVLGFGAMGFMLRTRRRTAISFG